MPAVLRTVFRHSVVIPVVLAVLAGLAVGVSARSTRDFPVSAHRYGYRIGSASKVEIRVQEGDVVRVTFAADDIPHSFTIEDAPYRIMRKAEPGKPVSFDFRADQPGRFAFFCNLTIDDKCKEMRGTLICFSRLRVCAMS